MLYITSISEVFRFCYSSVFSVFCFFYASFDTFTSSANFPAAFPLSIASFARVIPSSMVDAAPPTYRVAPAFSNTMSRVAPFSSPERIFFVITAFSVPSPPRSSSKEARFKPNCSGVMVNVLTFPSLISDITVSVVVVI